MPLATYEDRAARDAFILGLIPRIVDQGGRADHVYTAMHYEETGGYRSGARRVVKVSVYCMVTPVADLPVL